MPLPKSIPPPIVKFRQQIGGGYGTGNRTLGGNGSYL